MTTANRISWRYWGMRRRIMPNTKPISIEATPEVMRTTLANVVLPISSENDTVDVSNTP